ncbi:MAG: hypothetical protein QW179_02180 [Candidatus Hadarchaeales archaeon]
MTEKEVFETTLTVKGQVVIGSKARKKLGLRPRQKLLGKIEKGRIVLEPLETPEDLRGTLGIARGRKTEELVKEIKEGWR